MSLPLQRPAVSPRSRKTRPAVPQAPPGKIEFFHTRIAPGAAQRVAQVLESTWVGEGLMVRRFEQELARWGLAHPVAVNSCTAALHLALLAAGVGPGDEVILPPQTFIATGMAVLATGARAVFADIDPATGNLNPEDLPRRITPRTRAVIVVHWGGLPAAMDRIAQVAREHHLVVIEDAAHAFGARYRGRPIGSLSPFTCFSFQAIKHFTCGDGGAVCSPDAELAAAVRRRRWFGIDRENVRRNRYGGRELAVSELGLKYHMNDIAAAVGLANLEEFAPRLERRRKLGALYRRRLASVPGVELPRLDPECDHAYWLFPLLVEERDRFVEKLAQHGIPTSMVDMRIDTNPVFGQTPQQREQLQGQAQFEARQIHIPLHDGLSDEQVEYLLQVIASGW